VLPNSLPSPNDHVAASIYHEIHWYTLLVCAGRSRSLIGSFWIHFQHLSWGTSICHECMAVFTNHQWAQWILRFLYHEICFWHIAWNLKISHRKFMISWLDDLQYLHTSFKTLGRVCPYIHTEINNNVLKFKHLWKITRISWKRSREKQTLIKNLLGLMSPGASPQFHQIDTVWYLWLLKETKRLISIYPLHEHQDPGPCSESAWNNSMSRIPASLDGKQNVEACQKKRLIIFQLFNCCWELASRF